MSALGLLSAVLALAAPQEVTTIPNEVACSTCTIDVEEVATLGGQDGDQLLADMMGEAVVRDEDGGYWLFSYRLDDVLWRFTPAGRATLVGKRGQGPKEFASIRGLGILADGRVLAIDRGNARIVVLDETEVAEEVLYHSPGMALGNIVPVAGDTVLVATVSMATESVGVPIHAIDVTTGRAVVTLGSPVDVYQVQLTQRYQGRRIDFDNGLVLAGHEWAYALDLFDWPTRTLLRSVVREEPWFPPADLEALNPPRTRPASRTMGVRLNGDTTAIVLLRRPRPDWLEGYPDREDRSGREAGPRTEALVFETVVEHVDLIAGEVLSRKILPGSPLAFVGGEDQIAVLHDDGLVPSIRIYELSVRRK